ncbi:unnamed protein product, partial [Thlaspi arvense]
GPIGHILRPLNIFTTTTSPVLVSVGRSVDGGDLIGRLEKPLKMEKSTLTATQIAEPPPSATSNLAAQDLSLPTAADERSSPAMELDSSPGAAAQAHVGAQVPAPPLIAATDPSSRGRKRALEGNLQIENSNYYKLRLLVKDVRPQVLELLRTPDFRNCKAATEIQEKMKLMLQLYQEMIGETPKREKATKSESLPNGKATNQTPHHSTITTEVRSSETSSVQHNSDTVVGGSAFGWNFVTYGGTDAVYCGMSKEEYRGSHPIIPAVVEAELHNTS